MSSFVSMLAESDESVFPNPGFWTSQPEYLNLSQDSSDVTLTEQQNGISVPKVSVRHSSEHCKYTSTDLSLDIVIIRDISSISCLRHLTLQLTKVLCLSGQQSACVLSASSLDACIWQAPLHFDEVTVVNLLELAQL